jgi:hypothetical protein
VKAIFRACSISPQQKRQKSQIDELQAGIEQALGIFPKPSAFLQPGKGPLNNSALWQYSIAKYAVHNAGPLATTL